MKGQSPFKNLEKIMDSCLKKHTYKHKYIHIHTYIYIYIICTHTHTYIYILNIYAHIHTPMVSCQGDPGRLGWGLNPELNDFWV